MHAMNFLMSKLLSKAEFTKPDVKLFLIKYTVFESNTMEWAVVYRVTIDIRKVYQGLCISL